MAGSDDSGLDDEYVELREEARAFKKRIRDSKRWAERNPSGVGPIDLVANVEEVVGEDLLDSDDEDYEPDMLLDSDNEIGHDDDDLYADNVDEDEPEQRDEKKSNEKAKQKGKEKVVPTNQQKGKEAYQSDEDMSKNDVLWVTYSNDEELNLKFKSFREDDLHKPKFHVGQVFESVELLRTAIKEYSCQNRVDIKLPVNDRKRLKAKCDEDCTCYLWVSSTRSEYGSHNQKVGCRVIRLQRIYFSQHFCPCFRL